VTTTLHYTRKMHNSCFPIQKDVTQFYPQNYYGSRPWFYKAARASHRGSFRKSPYVPESRRRGYNHKYTRYPQRPVDFSFQTTHIITPNHRTVTGGTVTATLDYNNGTEPVRYRNSEGIPEACPRTIITAMAELSEELPMEPVSNKFKKVKGGMAIDTGSGFSVFSPVVIHPSKVAARALPILKIPDSHTIPVQQLPPPPPLPLVIEQPEIKPETVTEKNVTTGKFLSVCNHSNSGVVITLSATSAANSQVELSFEWFKQQTDRIIELAQLAETDNDQLDTISAGVNIRAILDLTISFKKVIETAM
jgi:hypothetical protein